MDIDPVSLEVARNRLQIIAEEMQAALVRSAHSSIVKEAHDASAGILDHRAGIIAQARGVPVHLGSLDSAVARICRSYPPADMQVGDVYIINDPYEDAQHLPDIVIAMPVIVAGRVVALAASMAHHQDIGGMTAGSAPQQATELYQEGLIIPPLKLRDAGVPNDMLLAIIAKNVRIPDVVLGDLDAQIACAITGVKGIERLCAEYGLERTLRVFDVLQDRAESMTRASIAEIPDGIYEFEDYLDNDGVDLGQRIRIKATVTVENTDLKVDFTGTDRQVRGPFNAMPSVAASAVRYVVRAITDPDIPNNAGCYRPLKIRVPRGSLLDPMHPAPVSSRGATLRRIIDVVMGALVQAIPDRVTAANNGHPLVAWIAGRDPRAANRYVTTLLTTGGMGARPTKDGLEAICTDASNSMNVPIEALETYFPIRVLRWGLRDDSGGPGQWRGGVGLECFLEVLAGDAVISHRGERHFTAPWGLFGGRPGTMSKSVIVRTDGSRHVVPSKEDVHMAPGDRAYFYTTGGGGYGDPLSRDPNLVLRDVIERKVSRSAAREQYGVLVEGRSNPHVDELGTRRARDMMSASRGQISWTYDRGDSGLTTERE